MAGWSVASMAHEWAALLADTTVGQLAEWWVYEMVGNWGTRWAEYWALHRAEATAVLLAAY